MQIDIRTMVAILGITHLVQVGVFWLQYRISKGYPGVGWWLLWSAAEVAAFAFMLLRQVPGLTAVAIIVQNAMLLAGTIFIYIGVRQFLGASVNRRAVLSLFAAYVSALVFFLVVHDDIAARSVIISAALAAAAFATARALLAHPVAPAAAAAKVNAVVQLVHGGIFAHRAVMILSGAPADDPFSPELFNAILYLDGLVVSMLWTYGFILMVNQRLHAEMKEARDHFEAIFQTGPDAALITRLEDGVIVNVNERFTEMTGYGREDAVGKTTKEIRAWQDPGERERLMRDLLDGKGCRNREAVFRRKDGNCITGLVSAKIIALHDAPHVISMTRDITDHKRTLAQVKQLSGLLPICASCKKVRGDQGYWEEVVEYVTRHSDAVFSHGLCPDCERRAYRELEALGPGGPE